MLFVDAPAIAMPQATVLTIKPESFNQKWDKGPWRAWALSGGACLTIYQESRTSQDVFWGFRQSAGSRVEFIVDFSSQNFPNQQPSAGWDNP